MISVNYDSSDNYKKLNARIAYSGFVHINKPHDLISHKLAPT